MVEIEISELVQVPLDELWPVVSDVLRLREYAAWEIASARPSNACDPGLEYRWHEQGVLMGKRYECDCTFFGWEPPHWVCFGTRNLFHVSYELEPAEGGTTLSLRVEWPHVAEARRDAHTALCQKTLSNLKLLVERPSTG